MPRTLKPKETAQHPARKLALEPYLKTLRAWCASDAARLAPDRPAEIKIGSRSLLLDPWERAQLLRADHLESGDEDHATIVTQGVGLIVKVIHDVESLASPTRLATADLYALQAELMLDTALGMALAQELQRAVDRAAAAGSTEITKHLSGFLNRLTVVVSEARQRIAGAELEQAEALSKTLTAQPAADPEPRPEPEARAPAVPALETPSGVDAIGQLHEEPGHASIDVELEALVIDDQDVSPFAAASGVRVPRRRASRPRRATSPAAPAGSRSSSLTRLLAVVLMIVATTWLGLVWLPAHRNAPTAVPTAEDLGLAVPVASVDSRMPALYVTIDGAPWQAMNPRQRDQLLAVLGRRASAAGYAAAWLRTAEGRSLGYWWRGEGSRVVESGTASPGAAGAASAQPPPGGERM